MADFERQETDDKDRHDILAYQGGQRRAFHAIFKRHERPSYAFILRRVPAEADATDVWQKAWIKVARNLGNWRPNEPFRSYLYAALRTQVIDHYRVTGHKPPMEVVDAQGSSVLDSLPAPEHDHGDPTLRRALTNCLQSLDAHERALLIGVYLEGAPQAEIERELALSRRQGIELMKRAKMKVVACLRAKKGELL